MLKSKKYIILAFQNKVWKCEKQVIILVIPSAEEWHYLTVKKYLY